MSALSRKAFTVALLPTLIFLLARNKGVAATEHDWEIELYETTYRVGPGDTGEIIYHKRYRALTAKGRNVLSRLHVPYMSAFQDVEVKSIRTLKKDGSVVQGDPMGVIDSASSDDELMQSFSDSRVKTILPPNVETGDSVEYEAVVHIHKWMKSGEFWFSHDLVTGFPVHSEKVVLDLPADRKVAFYESETTHGTTEIANGRRIETWTSSDPEASKVGSRPLPLFAVSSILSWDAFGDWVSALNRESVQPTPEIAALAAKLTLGITSDPDRITALYTYVATKVRYVSASFGLGRWQPHTAAMVLHNAYGDCKDQAALLSALLTAEGFKTHAVLNTPGVGVIVKDVPLPEFSHEFIAVESKSGLIFLDTSMGPVSPQVLQPGVRGRNAVLVGTKTAVIEILLNSPVQERYLVTVRGRVNANGEYEGFARIEFQGRMEAYMRRLFLDASDAEKEKILRGAVNGNLQGATIRQVSHSDPSVLGKPFWVECQLHAKDFLSPARTNTSFDPRAPGTIPVDTRNTPNQPVPVEPFSFEATSDLIVDPSLTIVSSMPVHRKAVFGSFDFDSSYKNGHLLEKHSMEMAGGIIQPADWDVFTQFLKAWLSNITKGARLERHSASPASVASSASGLVAAGSEAYRRGDFEEAKKKYLEATRLDPKSQTAWGNLGRAYNALRDYPKAEESYKRQIEINPDDKYSYNNLALVYRATAREDEAMELLHKQIGLNPRSMAHYNLAFGYATKREWDKAREEAAIAAEISPEDATRWSRLGQMQMKSGHIEEGLKSFDRALTIVHDATIENNIAFYMADAGIQLDRAMKLVMATLEPQARAVCDPESLSKDDKCAAPLRRLLFMLDTAGWVLYRQGKFAEAEPYLLAAEAIGPRADSELHLSATLAKLGRLDESLKYFATARARNDFARFDSDEARRELAKVVGGEAELDARLNQTKAPAKTPLKDRVLVLVDGHGKVLQAQAADDDTPPLLVETAKSLTLLPIAWPGHSIRSVRTIAFRDDGSRTSYVGPPAKR
jgi:tetratricopeptide (TPR) repeat protein